MFTLWFGFSFAVCAGAQNGKSPETRIRIVFENGSVIVALFDNPVSRDFLSLLPLSATFEDYAGAEKIAYLPRKLTTQGGISGREARGDFAYYAPWGNLAVFYRGHGEAAGLHILGRIESEKEKLSEKLSAMPGNFNAIMEIVE
jgi:hypothetical protein